MINFENVSKFIISDVSLHIPKGTVTGLIGHTGAGKTTLVRLAAGLLLPERGRVRVMSEDPIAYRGKYGSKLSVFLAGVHHLADEDSAMTALNMLQEMYRIPKDIFEARYNELSERFGFKAYERNPLKSLSVGQRQRVELASVFIMDSELMILDEPEVGLDDMGKQALEELIRDRASRGATFLITSHNMAGISKTCSRLAILAKGHLIFHGSEDSLRSRYLPINTLTITYEGAIPNIDDLPIVRYRMEGKQISYDYNSRYITASELMEVLMAQTEITDIKIKKPDLEQIVISIMKSEEKDEFYRGKEHQQKI
ncbi:MAG: ABC transporter ATP-binding protein [Eubacterium sp.]|nr:ABC transporter ATP-binding protein [Eubacterium sp.]